MGAHRGKCGNVDMMDETESTNNEELSLDFHVLKSNLLRNRTETHALELFQQLLSISMNNLDDLSIETFHDLKDLIHCIFDSISVPNLFQQPQSLLLNAITRSPSSVVTIIVDYLLNHLSDVKAFLSVSNTEVTLALANRIIESACAESVANLLWQFLNVNVVKEKLESLLANNRAEERFRIFQVISIFLKEGGEPQQVSSFINALEKELLSTDILSQLNAVEMFADVASQQAAVASYLISTGFVDRLYKYFVEITDHPDMGFIFPALVKFFGHLSVVNVDCLLKYPKFLDSVFDLVFHFDMLDPCQRLLAFDTIAVIGSNDTGKLFLHKISDHYDLIKTMNAFGAAIGSGPLELRVRHMDALAMLVHVENPVDDNISMIVESWVRNIGEPFPTLLMAYYTKPFNDIRLSSERLILELLNYSWMIEKLMTVPNFLDKILDRSVQTTAEGMQMKHEIVCKLIDSNSTAIPAPYMSKLQLYQREGPYCQSIQNIEMSNP